MAIIRTYVSDKTATRKSVRRVKEDSKSDAKFAMGAALKIEEDPSLMEGLTSVIASLVQHTEVLKVFDRIFASHAICKAYKGAYKAYLLAKLK